MRFDEWTTEAHRSLHAWNPEPVVSTAASTAVLPAAPKGRWMLSAAAVGLVVAAAAALLSGVVGPADTDVAVGPQASASPAGESPAAAEPPAAERPPDWELGAPQFHCNAIDQEHGAPTDGFDESTAIASWRAVDPDALGRSVGSAPPARELPILVTGSMTLPPGENLAATVMRSAAFVAAPVEGWSCNVESPVTDVSDPSRPGPIVDESNTLTNRMGGMCYVPDATTVPGSVWGVDPALAAALDRVDGLTTWNVILADGGRNGVEPGRLWMEFTYEADPGGSDRGNVARIVADVEAAVAAAGAVAGVPTECTPH